MTRVSFAIVLSAAILAPSAAPAQVRIQDPSSRRVEVAVGASWLGGTHLGEDAATLRGRGGDEFVLFRSDSHFDAAVGVEARVGYALTRRFGVEARVALARPEIRTSVSADAEGAPPLELAERLDRYTFEGAALVALGGLSAGRLVPFAAAGAGYVRQLHEGRTLVDQGLAVHVGGGVRQQLFERANAFISSGGIRGEARLYLLSDELALGDGSRPHVAASGSFFLTF